MSDKIITVTAKGFDVVPSQDYLDRQAKLVNIDINKRIEAKLDLLLERIGE